jgi:hypothetical protein
MAQRPTAARSRLRNARSVFHRWVAERRCTWPGPALYERQHSLLNSAPVTEYLETHLEIWYLAGVRHTVGGQRAKTCQTTAAKR